MAAVFQPEELDEQEVQGKLHDGVWCLFLGRKLLKERRL
jgi:hypothetical protein